jgi:hypothetical protein
MLDLAVTWLSILGTITFGAGLTIWYGGGNKTYAIWITFFGAIVLALGLALHFQKFVLEDSRPKSEETPPAQRTWLAIDVKIGGDLIVDKNGVGQPFAITLSQSGAVPALDAVIMPMLFLPDKQPFSSDEIIKSKTQGFGSSSLGRSIFPNKSVMELIIASAPFEVVGGNKEVGPFALVAVKYKCPGSAKVYLTAELFSLARRKNGLGGVYSIDVTNGNVPAGDLVLVPLGSYAD